VNNCIDDITAKNLAELEKQNKNMEEFKVFIEQEYIEFFKTRKQFRK